MSQRDRNPREIDVHIDELVLDGFGSSGRRHIAGALSAELGRLLAAEGIPAAWENNPERLRAKNTSPVSLTTKGATGAKIARAIYNSESIAS
jgi:hypothetical protein